MPKLPLRGPVDQPGQLTDIELGEILRLQPDRTTAFGHTDLPR
jgi:hypothetical protein